MDKNYGELYNILGWGEEYFAVNTEGHLSVKPFGRWTEPGQEIDVHSVIVEALATQPNDSTSKSQFPMILRFPDVLKNRIETLHNAFNSAMESTGYTSRYQGVFPIKVNQNKHVVQDMVRFGQQWNYGLEAGSKPELLIAMSCLPVTEAEPKPYLICNGYKDADYIALALSARAMGLNPIIVLEMEEELAIVLDQYKKLQQKLPDDDAVRRKKFEPVIGIRAKLLTKLPGHFGSTAGKHGKFGMLADQIYEVAETLGKEGKLHWLQLLHFHIGSMIPTTGKVYDAVSEAAGIYCNLVNEHGAKWLATLDCGGGLGVDYDGTRSGDSDMSVAYGIQEYASAVVQAVRLKCDYNGVAHPVVCTESGRAMASHHSMIILETLSAIPEPQDEDTSEQLLNRIQDLSYKQPRAPVGGATAAVYSHAADLKKHGIEMYKLGKKLGKRVVADANTVYNYHMNLSVFSLVPDFWGIGQLFPMMPVSRLNEEPTLKGTLVDITCDSDGKIENFISCENTLPLHLFEPSLGGYYVAVLVSGAYQEAIAGKHNLFSGPTLVRVNSSTTKDGGFEIERVDLGPAADEIIGSMRYSVEEDIITVIEKKAKGTEEEERVWAWEMVEPLMTKALTTMPYLNEYKVPEPEPEPEPIP